jgi:hypothetical protein
MSLRELTKNRGSFASDEALTKLFYLALRSISQKWTLPIHDWKAALFGGRINQVFRIRVSDDNSTANRCQLIVA